MLRKYQKKRHLPLYGICKNTYQYFLIQLKDVLFVVNYLTLIQKEFIGKLKENIIVAVAVILFPTTMIEVAIKLSDILHLKS